MVEAASRAPDVPLIPLAPPGTVTVTVAPGWSGAVWTYSMVESESRCHVPGTSGLRVGSGLDAASGWLRAIRIDADESTVDASAGTVAVTAICEGAMVLTGPALVLALDDPRVKITAPAATRAMATRMTNPTMSGVRRDDGAACAPAISSIYPPEDHRIIALVRRPSR